MTTTALLLQLLSAVGIPVFTPVTLHSSVSSILQQWWQTENLSCFFPAQGKFQNSSQDVNERINACMDLHFYLQSGV